MTATRQATPRQRHTSAWLFLRSLILALGCFGAVASTQAAPFPTKADWVFRHAGSGGLKVSDGAIFNNAAFSRDGITFNAFTNPPFAAWGNQTGHGGGVFVKTGAVGQIYTSTNGVDWANRSPGGEDITDVSYGNGIFVIRKFWSTGDMWVTSNFGASWTSVDTGDAPSRFYGTLIYGSGKFLYPLVNVVRESSNGLTWTSRVIPSIPAGFEMSMVHMHDGTHFVGARELRRNGGAVEVVTARSSDGVNWTFKSANITSTASGPFASSGHGGGYIMICSQGAPAEVWVSADRGDSWSKVDGPWADVSVSGANFAVKDEMLAVSTSAGIYSTEMGIEQSPTVGTPTASSITATSATLGGNVTADGGFEITERGVVYSVTATNADPLINGAGVTKVTATGTSGVFTAPVSELTPGANYSYKGFATNSLGTTYSSVATFTTLSTNADLSALTLSSGTLSPNFASGTSAYTASVSNATTSITVTPTRSQTNATIEARVNGGSYAAVTSETASGALLLNVGINIVDLRVTAQDGTTQRTYTVTVTRMAQLASNVTATRRPGTKVVDITYDLAAPSVGSAVVTLEVSSDGGATWTVPVASATGAVGGSVTPGTGKAIVWNAGADWPQSYSTQMQFRVVADDLVPQGFSSIPGGSFTMGRTSGDTDVDAPSITVTVSPFYMQQTETTEAQWDEVRTWGLSNGYTDLAMGGGKDTNHPVQAITWWDVVKWCNARSEKEGLTPVYTVSGAVMRTGTTEPAANWSVNGYRLPTEAEWEKAARGGLSGKRFPWGTDTISHAEANYGGSPEIVYDQSRNYHPSYKDANAPYTAPVGSFEANMYGLYDVAGNVWEWCWEWYGPHYYTTSNGTTNPRGPESGSVRVRRGGSSQTSSPEARCGARNHFTPGLITNADTGFRPARSSVGSSNPQTVSLTLDTRDAPTVNTTTSTSITATSATLGGNVTADGGAPITESGVVYSVTAANANPAIGGTGVTKITATGTTDVFTAPVTGLTQGSSYSYKAYATNSQGTSYSTVVTFTTLSTMTTPTVTSITTTGATLGGTVVSLAGGRPVERGVLYSDVAANPDPQLEGLGVIKLPRSGSIGTFTVAASGLSPAKTYAYRAYLTTSIETSYSGVGYFTTDTPVAFTSGIGTVSNRVIRGGESQLFVFDLAQSSAAAFSTTGASPAMQWELRDSQNGLVDSGMGNVDFSSVLALGGYQLRITNPGASTETYSLNLDASTPASPRPDVSVGLDRTASSGVDLYNPPAPQQSVLAISTKAAIKNVFFRIDNDGPLPDAMRINGPGHDSRFRVLYVLAGRNVTAEVIAGTATTAVLAAADAPVPLFVRISPNRKNTDILRKVVVNQRLTWVYGRETFGPNGLTVRATTDPTLSDTATFQLNTVP